MFEDILDVKGCVCGKDHSLTTREYVVERDAMAKLPALLDKLGFAEKPLAVYDSNTYKAAHDKLERFLPGVDTIILTDDEIHPDETQIAKVSAAAPGHSVLLAVGGGVICDITRCTAFQLELPFIAVPTAASVDGFVSGSAAMVINGAKVSLPTKAPNAVVADLEIIAAAPRKLTASGVGDMLSKYISIADWKIGQLISDEYYCPVIADWEIQAVNLIVEQIDAIARGDIDSMGKLMEGLLLSGIAMQAAEITRPASSFEHHFSHYLETVPVGGNIKTDALHGEKVGIATIAAAKYYPAFADSLKRIFEEDLPNRFDMNRVVSYYSRYPQDVVDRVVKENTPTISLALDKELLRKNYDEVVKIAHSLPSATLLLNTLKTVGGYTDYRDIDMTPEEYRNTMKICCYIRNRFTMLRLVCDYELFDFDALDD